MEAGIQKYLIDDAGYHPFLIRGGWQVAQLNYNPEMDINKIQKVEVHRNTDEVFILIKGSAILIGAYLDNSRVTFQVEPMIVGVTYNVPAGHWHNIASRPGSEIIIVEKSNTHLHDVEYFDLAEKHIVEMKKLVLEAFDEMM